MDSRGHLLIVGGFASGLVSAALICVLVIPMWIVPGLLFAACVIGPWSRMVGQSSPEAWGNAWRCVVGYVAAHLISVATWYVATPVGAAVGSGIMLSTQFTNPSAVVRRAAWRALAMGTITALIFTGFTFVPEGWWGLLLGIIVWQVAVAAALASAFRTKIGVTEEHRTKCPHCGVALPIMVDAFCLYCREPLVD